MRHTAAMQTDMWHEEHDIANFRVLVCRECFRWYTPTMKAPIWKRSQKRAIGFEEGPFRGVRRQSGQDLTYRPLSLNGPRDVHRVRGTNVHDKAIHGMTGSL
jgi:hypothetical protein